MSPLRLRTWTSAQLDQFATAARTFAIGIFLALLKDANVLLVTFCCCVFAAGMAATWYVASFNRD